MLAGEMKRIQVQNKAVPKHANEGQFCLDFGGCTSALPCGNPDSGPKTPVPDDLVLAEALEKLRFSE